MIKRRIGKSGFTLIEVIIALAVLVFGIYGVLDLFFNSQRLGQRSRFRTQALCLAKGKIAQLMAADTDQIFSFAEQSEGRYTSESATISEDDDFMWNWTATREDLDSNTLRIEVNVWKIQQPSTRVNLFSYISSGG